MAPASVNKLMHKNTNLPVKANQLISYAFFSLAIGLYAVVNQS
jgi:hypothetical protein